MQVASAVTRTFADAHGLTTLSDLAGHEGGLVLGGPADCPVRPACRPGLEETCGVDLDGCVPLDDGGPLTKEAQGEVQVGLVLSSDGELSPLARPSGTR